MFTNLSTCNKLGSDVESVRKNYKIKAIQQLEDVLIIEILKFK